MAESPLCEYGDIKTVKHIVEMCPSTMFNERLAKLHERGPSATKWLEKLSIHL